MSTYSISGNTGVAGATITYVSGDFELETGLGHFLLEDGSGIIQLEGSSGSVIADGSGNYSISGLVNGAYTITPSKTGYIFSPTSANETVSGADITGVNFTATPSTPTATVYSVPDCRVAPFGPNTGITVQGTIQYTGQTSCDKLMPRVDSRAAGAPVDSRKAPNIPENSRTPGTYGPGE